MSWNIIYLDRLERMIDAIAGLKWWEDVLAIS